MHSAKSSPPSLSFICSEGSDQNGCCDIKEFLKLVGALWSCKGKETNPLRKSKVSNELLDFFYEKPVHMLVTDTSHNWEEAERGQPCSPGEKFWAGVCTGGCRGLLSASERVQGGQLPCRWKSDRPSDCPPDRPQLQAPRRWSSGLPPDCLRFLHPHYLASRQIATVSSATVVTVSWATFATASSISSSSQIVGSARLPPPTWF